MSHNHPSILAFEYTWIQEIDSSREPFTTRFGYIGARNLANFHSMAAAEGHPDITLHAVHHVSAEDGFTLTDLVWRKPDRNEFPCSYCDQLAQESWAQQATSLPST
jgi:hypothetical protein